MNCQKISIILFAWKLMTAKNHFNSHYLSRHVVQFFIIINEFTIYCEEISLISLLIFHSFSLASIFISLCSYYLVKWIPSMAASSKICFICLNFELLSIIRVIGNLIWIKINLILKWKVCAVVFVLTQNSVNFQ